MINFWLHLSSGLVHFLGLADIPEKLRSYLCIIYNQDEVSYMFTPLRGASSLSSIRRTNSLIIWYSASQKSFDDAFIQSQNAFLASLSPNEQALFSSCQSPAQLIKDIERLDASKNRRRLLRALEKVKQFSDRLEPYFDTVGIIVQAHPEVAAITWGAIRFILQVRAMLHNFVYTILLITTASL